MLCQGFIPAPQNYKFNSYVQYFRSLLKKIIEEDPESIMSGEVQIPSLIGILKAYRDPLSGNPLSSEEVVGHVGSLFFAGHDTTANFYYDAGLSNLGPK